MRFADLKVQALRFFLKGQPQHVYRLYELLFNQALGVAVGKAANDPDPIVLGPDRLRQVGFEREEGLLPYPVLRTVNLAGTFVAGALVAKYRIDVSGWFSRQRPRAVFALLFPATPHALDRYLITW